MASPLTPRSPTVFTDNVSSGCARTLPFLSTTLIAAALLGDEEPAVRQEAKSTGEFSPETTTERCTR